MGVKVPVDADLRGICDLGTREDSALGEEEAQQRARYIDIVTRSVVGLGQPGDLGGRETKALGEGFESIGVALVGADKVAAEGEKTGEEEGAG